MSSDTWDCPNCGFHNAAEHSRCPFCFADPDAVCVGCGNHGHWVRDCKEHQQYALVHSSYLTYLRVRNVLPSSSEYIEKDDMWRISKTQYTAKSFYFPQLTRENRKSVNLVEFATEYMANTCTNYELSVKPKNRPNFRPYSDDIKVLIDEDGPTMDVVPKILEVFPSWKWRRPFYKIVVWNALREMLQEHKAFKCLCVRGKQNISPMDNMGHSETINTFYSDREVDTVDIWWMMVKEDREYYITLLQGYIRSIDPVNAWRMNDIFAIGLQYLDDSVPLKNANKSKAVSEKEEIPRLDRRNTTFLNLNSTITRLQLELDHLDGELKPDSVCNCIVIRFQKRHYRKLHPFH